MENLVTPLLTTNLNIDFASILTSPASRISIVLLNLETGACIDLLPASVTSISILNSLTGSSTNLLPIDLEYIAFVYDSLYFYTNSSTISFQEFSWEGESISYYLIDFIPLTAFNVYGTLLTAKNVVLRAGLEVEPVLDPTSLMYIDPLFIDGNPAFINEDGIDERITFKYTLPKAKLMYPEPFIASPSYNHSDLYFLCILQYWYWLWVIFIYLIALFFLSFLVVARWCSTHKRNVRETQGVSRSKCGDLITAGVPVTWAISIIIGESTDATDINDGFGTGEIIIGVRAYQWGWEYYYPRSIDLLYNINPTYSTFTGNSIRYSHTSSLSSTSSSFWKQYQSKTQDSVVTPASLLFHTLDVHSNGSFDSKQNIGRSSLKLSSAFPKIRNNTKIYNTHLLSHPTTSWEKSYNVASLFNRESDSLLTFDNNLKRKSDFVKSTQLVDIQSVSKENNSLQKFLNSDLTPITQSKASVFVQGQSLPHVTSVYNSTIGIPTKSDLLYTPTLSDSEDKILVTDRTISQQNFNHPLLKALSSQAANITNWNSVSKDLLSGKETLTYLSDYKQSQLLTNSLSARVFSKLPLQPFFSSSSTRNHNYPSFYDSNSIHISKLKNLIGENHQTVTESNTMLNPLVGVTEKIPESLLKMYWSTCWSNLSPDLRDKALREGFSIDADTLLPQFTTYADYDFRNEQSLTLLEDLFWEAPFSSYNFYDYQFISELSTHKESVTPILTEMLNLPNTGLWSTNPSSRSNQPLLNVLVPTSDDFIKPSSKLSQRDLRLLSLNDPVSDLEDSYREFKSLDSLQVNLTSNLVWEGNSLKGTLPTSKAFNRFLSTFEESTYSSSQKVENLGLETSHFEINTKGTSSIRLWRVYFKSLVASGAFDWLFPFGDRYVLNDTEWRPLPSLFWVFWFIGLQDAFKGSLVYCLVDGKWSDAISFLPYLKDEIMLDVFYGEGLIESQYSEPTSQNYFNPYTAEGSTVSSLVIRPSVKDSIITTNAFQKVFRSKLDESRSLINLSTLSNLYTKQPFIVDQHSPYTNLLTKDTLNFYSTTFYVMKPRRLSSTLPELFTQPMTQMFEFPFLDALQSDLIRYTWMDGYSKWDYIEVQPASVSKYSTLGVPYVRKPYDFSTNVGDSISETLSYFIRLSKLRRNYLPNWLYSPLLYNRSRMLQDILPLKQLMLSHSLSPEKTLEFLLALKSQRNSRSYNLETSPQSSASFSGNSIYHKSKWRPQSTPGSYYYSTTKLVDILTKRERLAKDVVFSRTGLNSLPALWSSSPSNPLLKSVKQAFRLEDPLTFSSEYSRDYTYSSLQYFKYLQVKSQALASSSDRADALYNSSLINDYILFYFLSSDSGNQATNVLYKNQHRPLRKGINSMLRLHATGAVAMPIEVRLQILASSKDVIHSWSVPSAGIKIDCIPGYTSHRIMKFMLTGIYWGQCQEICGRYHHWMPIVVYFINRDLFFLWCTHFVYKPQKHYNNHLSDRQFQNFVRFVSHDSSSWLSEINSAS